MPVSPLREDALVATDSTRRPMVGVTLGEASGVGPEVVAKALATLPSDVDACVYAADHLVDAARDAIHRAQSARPAADAPSGSVRFAPFVGSGRAPEPGVSDTSSRADAYGALAALADAACAGDIDAMLTGPVPKAVFAHLHPSPPGQTEFLAGRLGTATFAMMLAGPKLRVVPVTTHLPLRDVAGALRTDAIVRATWAAVVELRLVYGLEQPRVGVCGLNPHAGEGGRIGDEEGRVIAPAIAALQALGIDARGPLAADSAFRAGFTGSLDVVVAMYHDQALGQLKTVHFADAVNFTCGLPVPRLSPDHGTAYDIAGKGIADPTSTRVALDLACRAARSASRRASFLRGAP